MIQTKRVIFMTLPLLFVPLVYSISSTPNACAEPPDPFRGETTDCTATRTSSTCCWLEAQPPGSGRTFEKYCQTCTCIQRDQHGLCTQQDCEQKELQYLGGGIEQPTPTPTPTPLGPLGIPEGGVLQQPTPAPTSPLGPRPFTPLGEGSIQEPQTTPTPTPEDDQSDGGPGPFRGPLGGGVLQEPEDEENNNEPEDDGNEEQVP